MAGCGEFFFNAKKGVVVVNWYDGDWQVETYAWHAFDDDSRMTHYFLCNSKPQCHQAQVNGKIFFSFKKNRMDTWSMEISAKSLEIHKEMNEGW